MLTKSLEKLPNEKQCTLLEHLRITSYTVSDKIEVREKLCGFREF